MKRILIYLLIAIVVNYGIWIIYEISPYKTANQSLAIFVIIADILFFLTVITKLGKDFFKIK